MELFSYILFPFKSRSLYRMTLRSLGRTSGHNSKGWEEKRDRWKGSLLPLPPKVLKMTSTTDLKVGLPGVWGTCESLSLLLNYRHANGEGFYTSRGH
jgi:hypothetical protein